ncbi:3-oxoacyl-[acyl-carrier-protein] synthase III C-terminal domain-containing protein [Streptosporangium saharense]|uniref:3-oxoacyl-[acyl-carrier-protein] synthase III C-terminal domain-containing protein n=1 Tax=Streptosporangium saharense TaxID=1706840 RepID=UPI003322B8CA
MLTPHPVTRPIGLSRIAVGLPSGSEPVDDVLVRLGRPATERHIFSRIYKLGRSPVLGPGEDLEALLIETAARALDGRTTALVLYGHTMMGQSMSYLPGFADRFRGALGIPGAQLFGVSQIACTSVLRSIDLATRYLDWSGSSDPVLVLGGDQASLYDQVRLMPGVTVLGDAAAALLVSPSGAGRYRYLGGAALRDSRFHRSMRMPPEEFREFAAVCCERVVETIHAALETAGFGLADVDLIMPHHNNAMFWRSFANTTGFPRDRIHLDLLPELGHTFGSDSLLALHHADTAGLLKPGARCLLIAIGQGAYFQAALVEVTDDDSGM